MYLLLNDRINIFMSAVVIDTSLLQYSWELEIDLQSPGCQTINSIDFELKLFRLVQETRKECDSSLFNCQLRIYDFALIHHKKKKKKIVLNEHKKMSFISWDTSHIQRREIWPNEEKKNTCCWGQLDFWSLLKSMAAWDSNSFEFIVSIITQIGLRS